MTAKHTPGPWTWISDDALWSEKDGSVICAADDGKPYGLHSPMIDHHFDDEVKAANKAVIACAPDFAEALDFLAGLHPGLTIDGPPMEVAKRIFDAVLAERSELKEQIQNMERNLATMRSVLAKTARTA